MAWLPTPGFDQSAEPPAPPEQGDMWGTLKQIMSGLPRDVGMQPMPLAYSPSAPSFISKLAQMPGAPLNMFLPEEYKGIQNYLRAGISPLQNRNSPSIIDKFGNAWSANPSHTETMMNVINSKNEPWGKIPIAQWLFNHEYDLPQWLGDYQNIRSAGNIGMGHNLQIPLNAPKDALNAAAELVPKGSLLISEYTMPTRGFPGNTTIPFRRALGDKYEKWKTFKKFDKREFMDYIQKQDEIIQGEFKKWIKNNPEAPQQRFPFYAEDPNMMAQQMRLRK